MTSRMVEVNDRMQRGYRYALVAPAGGDLHPDFRPDLTPADMLALGVFGGKYMTDCRDEFPASWFVAAKLSPERRDPALNWFGVDASQPLSVWRAKGWIHPDDPRGWFQWYCRYYQGRRMAREDERQIGRWKAMRRHLAQLRRRRGHGSWWSARPGSVPCHHPRRRNPPFDGSAVLVHPHARRVDHHDVAVVGLWSPQTDQRKRH